MCHVYGNELFIFVICNVPAFSTKTFRIYQRLFIDYVSALCPISIPWSTNIRLKLGIQHTVHFYFPYVKEHEPNSLPLACNVQLRGVVVAKRSRSHLRSYRSFHPELGVRSSLPLESRSDVSHAWNILPRSFQFLVSFVQFVVFRFSHSELSRAPFYSFYRLWCTACTVPPLLYKACAQ